MKKSSLAVRIMFIFVFVLSVGSFAQNKIDKFEYVPQDLVFWQEVTMAVKDNNGPYIIKIGEQKYRSNKKDSLAASEGELAMAIGFKINKNYYASLLALKNLILNKQGTNIATQALFELEIIAELVEPDEELMAELVYEQDYESLPVELNDFINYWTAYFNTKNDFKAWAEKDLAKISETSFWGQKLTYVKALEALKKNDLEQSLKIFTDLANGEKTYPKIKTEASHQMARLIFEKADYENAYELFKKVELNPREQGQLLLERAWSKYYQKDYSKALGLLTALEAPLFDPSRSAEAYILKMLIYKELCYYESAFDVLKEFNGRFQKSIESIKRRKDLKRDQALVNLAILDYGILNQVSYLNRLKEESFALDLLGLDRTAYFINLNKKYDLKIKYLDASLDFVMIQQLRKVANELLDWNEQISFLDYQTRIDSLRIQRPMSEVNYKPEEIPHMSFEKVYWIFKGEFWLDELEDLQVLVQSKCGIDGDRK